MVWGCSRQSWAGFGVAVWVFSGAAWADTAMQGDRMIVVAPGPERDAAETVLSPEERAESRPLSVADILRLAPSAHLPTNSRGETLLVLRNGGERQTALYYDGALLNIPWDNRFDLNLLPAGAVGGVTVIAGPVSSQYGLNSSGGVVELAAASPGAARLAADGEAGTGGLARADATLFHPSGSYGVLLAGGGFTQSGAPLSGEAGLPFSQENGSLRTNTDQERFYGLGRLETALGARADLRLTVLGAQSDRGIAPESDRDPTVNPVRFWRYPDTSLVMAILSGDAEPGPSARIKGAVWVQSFGQTIDSFTSAAYRRLEDRQEDRDLTVGGRFIASQRFGPHGLTVSVNGLQSTHEQTDTEFTDGPMESAALFRQRSASIGLEYDAALGEVLAVRFGGGLDFFSVPRSGGRPAFDPLLDYTVSGSLTWLPAPGWSVRLAGGRKTRFPTMRELFGTAINRFLLNPDLEPETVILSELTAGWQGPDAALKITPFASFTRGTIDQRTVVVDDTALRQRINLRGSRIFGLEIAGFARLSDSLTVNGALTATRVRRLADGPGDPRQIAERPELRARAALVYEPGWGLSFRAEADHTGRAFSADASGVLDPLPRSTVLNLGAALALDRLVPSGPPITLYLQADNVTDTLVLPQAGLPAPGRRVRGGLRLAF